MKPCDPGRVQAAADTLCVWSGCLPACACLTRPPVPVSAVINHSRVHHGRRKRSDVRQRVPGGHHPIHAPCFTDRQPVRTDSVWGRLAFSSLSPWTVAWRWSARSWKGTPHLHTRSLGPTNLHSGGLLVCGFSVALSPSPPFPQGAMFGVVFCHKGASVAELQAGK